MNDLVGLLGFLPGITIHFGGLKVAGQRYTADNWLHTALGAGMVACGLLRG